MTVNVTCSGKPAAGAEIKVKYSWFHAYKIRTDANGNATTKQRTTQEQRPSGSVDVTIKGSDGERTQKVTY